MQGFRFRLAQFVLKNRILVLAVLALATLFFLIGCSRVELRTIFSDLFPKTHDFVKTYKDHPNFGNPLTIVMMVKRTDGQNIYNTETLAKVWRMTRDIDLAPSVDHDQILSITTEKARYAEATPYGLESKPLMSDKAPDSDAEIEDFKRKVDKAPNVRTFLISNDETATIVQATFIEHSLDYGETFKYVQDLVERERDGTHYVYAAGAPMLTGWVYTYQKQMFMIFGVTAVLLVLALIVYMQNVPGVVTPILASVVSAIWGFGFVGWLNKPVEPLIMVVPMLLVARAFSHCVQFIERYYEIYYEVRDRRKAAEIALGVMMAPGILGIITDSVGLFLIGVAPIPAMERFALFCGFWALMLIPTDVFLSACVVSFFPPPRNVAKLIGKSEEKSWHDKIIAVLRKVGTFSHGARAPLTSAIFVVLALIGGYLMSQMKVGNPVEGSNLLYEDSEFNTAVRAINSHFPGLMTLEIVFESKEEGQDEATGRIMRYSDTIQTMLRLQRILESQPQPPEATLSLADYLPEANRLFSGGNPKWAPIDHNDEMTNAAVSALLLGSSPKNFGHVSDFTLTNGTVSLWYKDNKQDTVDVALAQTREALEEVNVDHDLFKIRLGTGAIALQQSVNDTVAHYEWVILAMLNLMIFITCSFAYRSVMAGIILMIPVNLSNMLLAAVMVMLGLGLDVNSLPIAAIGIGVGIDYGIYLLSRICEEFRDTNDHGQAIQKAVSTSGKAIAFTATIVLIGILPWYFLSELKFLADMGLLLVMIMLINMVIALIVLPLLVYWIKPGFIEKEHLIMSENADISDFLEGEGSVA